MLSCFHKSRIEGRAAVFREPPGGERTRPILSSYVNDPVCTAYPPPALRPPAFTAPGSSSRRRCAPSGSGTSPRACRSSLRPDHSPRGRCDRASSRCAGSPRTLSSHAVAPDSNVRKHGVTFEEAATAFLDDLAVPYEDPVHDDRFILVGMSLQLNLLLVVFAERARAGAETVRIISARRATRRERRVYEEGE